MCPSCRQPLTWSPRPSTAQFADREDVFSRPIFPTLICLLSPASTPTPTRERWRVAAPWTGARLPALQPPASSLSTASQVFANDRLGNCRSGRSEAHPSCCGNDCRTRGRRSKPGGRTTTGSGFIARGESDPGRIHSAGQGSPVAYGSPRAGPERKAKAKPRGRNPDDDDSNHPGTHIMIGTKNRGRSL